MTDNAEGVDDDGEGFDLVNAPYAPVELVTRLWLLIPVTALCAWLLPDLASNVDLTVYAVIAQIVPVFVLVYFVDQRRLGRFAKETRKLIDEKIKEF